jgi:hypothetical protein
MGSYSRETKQRRKYMNLITILTLGLCGRTKPEVIPVGPKLYKPYIGDIWELKDHSKWITPLPETINRIEILNISRTCGIVLYKHDTISGDTDTSLAFKLKHEITIEYLHLNYKLHSSEVRKVQKIIQDAKFAYNPKNPHRPIDGGPR